MKSDDILYKELFMLQAYF